MVKPAGSLDPDQLSQLMGETPEESGAYAPAFAEPTFEGPLAGANRTPMAPAPGTSSSSSLSEPVYRNTPEARQAADAKAVKAIDKLGTTVPPEDRQAILDQQTAQSKTSIDKFQEKSAANYQTSQDIINEHVVPLQKEADILAAEHDKAVSFRDAYQIRMQTGIDQMDNLSKKIAAEQPREFWADQSTGMKLATIALTALGGAAQSLGGDRTNAVADSIDNMVKRDTAMQKMRFEKNQDDYANQHTLVGQMAQNYDRLEHAQEAAYVTGMQGVIGRLQALKPMLDSAQMRQNVDMQIAQLEIKASEAHTKLQENLLGMGVRINQGVATLAEKRSEAQQKADIARLTASQKAATENRKTGQTETTIPGYEQDPKVKHINATPKESAAVRDDLATTSKVSNAMDYLKSVIKAAGNDPMKLLEFTNQAQFQQAQSVLLEAARGPGFGQTGSRMTEMLKTLETKAFTGGEWARFRSDIAAGLLDHAQKTIWDNLNLKAKSLGLQPILKGPEHHPWFGDE